MGLSQSLTTPLTEQDLCEPKFSLLVEKVWSSLDYNAVDEVRCAWWRIAVFWDDFEDEEIDNISYEDKHILSETYIESSRDESLESDSCW